MGNRLQHFYTPTGPGLAYLEAMSKPLVMWLNPSPLPSPPIRLQTIPLKGNLQPGQFASYSEYPFLKGIVSGSVLTDITSVKNKLLFLQELSAACEGNKHPWSVENIIHRDLNRHFAEITFSPTFYEKICTIGVSLPSFEKPFVRYSSLSPDFDIFRSPFRIFAVNMADLIMDYKGYERTWQIWNLLVPSLIVVLFAV